MKILCILYDDPKDGMPSSYPLKELPKLENYPDNFASILANQVGTIRLTTAAVLQKSKDAAFQALLADPVVDNFGSAEKLLNTMLTFQKEHLDYLK